MLNPKENKVWRVLKFSITKFMIILDIKEWLIIRKGLKI
jgi:hypothetical protein